MKHFTVACAAVGAVLALTIGPMQATGDDGGDVYARTMRQADQAGTLILFVYSVEADENLSDAAKRHLLARSRRGVTARLVIQFIPIDNTDRRYGAYRGRIQGEGHPFWVLAKPNGEFLAGGDYETVRDDGLGGWKDTVRPFTQQYPPIGARDRERISEALTQATEDLEAGRLGEVEPLVERFRSVWHTPELAQACASFCASYDQAVAEFTSRPTQLATAGQWVDAALAYQSIIDTFGRRSEAGREASEGLRQLLANHPDIRQAFETARRERAAAARAAENEDTPAEPSVPAAQDEADAADDADEPEPAPQADDDVAAGRLLRLAKMYHRQDMVDKAKAKLQECIDTFPDTPAAEEARGLMAQW